MIEDLLERLATPGATEERTFYGVVEAEVVGLLDPSNLGRVRVRASFIDDLDVLAWARVAAPMAGALHGHYFMPSVGDRVLVAFEHGNVNVPYVIGSLWNQAARPPLTSPLRGVRTVRTPGGNQLVFAEEQTSVTLQTGPTPPEAIPAPPSPTGPHHTLVLSPDGIEAASPTRVTLAVGTSTIVVTPEGITLQAAGNTVSLSADGVRIDAAGPVQVTASGTCSVSAPTITLN